MLKQLATNIFIEITCYNFSVICSWVIIIILLLSDAEPMDILVWIL